MIRNAFGAWRRFASRAALALASIVLASCGSGGVSNDNATAPGTGPVSISPTTATLYSGVPTTFAVSGGSGSYLVTSSDQNVVPLASNIRVNHFTVVPADVGSDTSITLSVHDANNATAAPATATLTVKPRTISNVVTITPSASQSAACGTAICAGGDAEVTAVLSQAGVPLVGRAVRFDVVSGDIRIITSPAGAPEEDSLSGSTTTDNSGHATIRIRALSDATSQTALLQITDLASGATQRTSVTIAPSSNAPLNAQPNTIVFQGTAPGTCATDVSADVIVFGGRPPYLVSSPGTFDVSPTTLTSSGERFTVHANGQCSAGSQIAIVDANGALVSVTASNQLSAAQPTPVQPLAVSPGNVTLDSCNAVANVIIVGGAGNYFAASGNSAVAVNVNGNTASITRADGPSAPSKVAVSFSDGTSVISVDVALTGGALGTCP